MDLYCAIIAGKLDVARRLLEQGADPNGALSLLHVCAVNNDLPAIQLLLEFGADTKRRDHWGLPPLYVACVYGSPEVCELLVKHDVEVNQKTRVPGHTPLSYLVSETSSAWALVGPAGRDDPIKFAECRKLIAHVLLQYGAQVSHKVRGKSILEIAAEDNFNESIRDALMQHTAKMRYLNLEIDEYDRQTIENTDCYGKYYHKYSQELEDMKEIKFYNNVSIFDIFTESKKTMPGYARNEELVKAFEEEVRDKWYSRYFAKFRAEVKKQKYRKTAAETLSSVFKLDDHSHPVIQEILCFLSECDLKFLDI